MFMKANNLIDLDQLSHAEVQELITLAGEIRKNPAWYMDACHGKIMATLFYEPSTRTQMSFQAAMLRLGGKVIGFDNPGNSSVSKGESLKDTVRIISNYSDLIVMRNPREGASLAASLYSRVPVINAGDGGHLHPTQTLTDLVTLSYEKGRLTNLTIGLCGDMKNGRTVHSLIKCLSQYEGNRFVLISTPQLQIPQYIRDVLHANNCPYACLDSLEAAIPELDVLYMTRIQQERFFNEEDYLRLKGCYSLNAKLLELAPSDMPVLHPLPRIDEIKLDVDSDPRAAYFDQVHNGVYIRMAIILALLGIPDPVTGNKVLK